MKQSIFLLAVLAAGAAYTLPATEVTVKRVVIVEAPGFRDAIVYTDAEYAAKSQAQIQADADARYTAHLARIEAEKNVKPVEPTKEELQAQEAELQAKLDAVKAAITAKDAKPVEEVKPE